MGILVSKLTADALNSLPYYLTHRYDMQNPEHAEATIEVGTDYLVGRYGDWQGRYWALEKATTVLFFSDSVKDIRAWIQRGRAALKGATHNE